MPDWWLFWTTLLGAVVGAVVSGTISYVLAKQAAGTQAASDQARVLETKKALAFRCVVKLKLLADTAHTIQSHLDEALAEAAAAGLDGPLWRRLKSAAGDQMPTPGWEIDELRLLVEMKEGTLLNDLLLLASRVRNLQALLAEYSRQRDAFLASIVPEGFVGDVGTIVLNADQLRLFQPRVIPLEQLATAIVASAREQRDDSMRLVGLLGPKLKAFFNDPHLPVAVAGGVEPNQPQ